MFNAIKEFILQEAKGDSLLNTSVRMLFGVVILYISSNIKFLRKNDERNQMDIKDLREKVDRCKHCCEIYRKEQREEFEKKINKKRDKMI